MNTNPLIATPVPTPPDTWSGVWIAEDIEQISQGITNNNWIDLSLGVTGASLDALALISDPLGVLLQYGVAWIIEHVKPLTHALDWLAGNPAQISAHAQTWRNIAADLHNRAADLATTARLDLTEWHSRAADAYRTWNQEQQHAIDALARIANLTATITEAAGYLIAAVRTLVRNAIATLASRLIVYAIEEAASLGIATALVVEQVTTLIASWAAKIARWLKSLLTSLRNLIPLTHRLGELSEELKKILNRLRSRDASGPTFSRHGDGIVRNGQRILMTMDNVKAIAVKYGIKTDGVKFAIDKSRAGGGPGKELFGITLSGGKVILTRDAFMNEEQMARTLAHEMFHVDEIRRGLPLPATRDAAKPWEERAYEFEKRWWEEHKHLLGQ